MSTTSADPRLSVLNERISRGDSHETQWRAWVGPSQTPKSNWSSTKFRKNEKVWFHGNGRENQPYIVTNITYDRFDDPQYTIQKQGERQPFQRAVGEEELHTYRE